MRKFYCQDCGKQYIPGVNIKGRMFPYRELEVELKEDMFLYGCPDGHDAALCNSDITKLDSILEKEYLRLKNE